MPSKPGIKYILVCTRSPCSFMDLPRRAMENHRPGCKARAQGHLQDDAFKAAVDMMAVTSFTRILRQRNMISLVITPSAEC